MSYGEDRLILKKLFYLLKHSKGENLNRLVKCLTKHKVLCCNSPEDIDLLSMTASLYKKGRTMCPNGESSCQKITTEDFLNVFDLVRVNECHTALVTQSVSRKPIK